MSEILAIHCIRCGSVNDGTNSLFITDCFHVFCYSCLQHYGETCLLCESTSIHLTELTPEIPSDIRQYFEPLAPRLQAIPKALAFQLDLNRRFINSRLPLLQGSVFKDAVKGYKEREVFASKLRMLYDEESLIIRKLNEVIAQKRRILVAREAKKRRQSQRLAKPGQLPWSFFGLHSKQLQNRPRTDRELQQKRPRQHAEEHGASSPKRPHCSRSNRSPTVLGSPRPGRNVSRRRNVDSSIFTERSFMADPRRNLFERKLVFSSPPHSYERPSQRQRQEGNDFFEF